MAQSESVELISREFKKIYTYENTEMLTLSIHYPELQLFSRASAAISRSYRRAAQNYYGDVSARLYPSAVHEWKDSQKYGFPFRPYEAVMDYQTMLNASCRFSTYTDRYEFTGGAHGNTLRSSDSRDTQTGKRIRLPDLFPEGANVRREITRMILRQAEKQQAAEPIYFDDYRMLILKYFNPASFYLTPDGVSFYYQQYELGPYVIGMPTFSFLYSELGVDPPECMPQLRGAVTA